MPIDRFISRWSASGDAERANKDSFLNELCDVLGVERPNPKTGGPARDLYVFEKDVMRTRAGGTSIGRVDLYKQGAATVPRGVTPRPGTGTVAVETSDPALTARTAPYEGSNAGRRDSSGHGAGPVPEIPAKS